MEVLKLRSELKMHRGFGRFVGTSAALEARLKQARAVADTSPPFSSPARTARARKCSPAPSTRRARGATGPSSPSAARRSPRRSSSRSCSATSKGRFTDAKADRVGRFELADGGTLFLDEIGELQQSVQVKLLRVLQERTFERVGSNRSVGVDIRLIAATNRDLEQEVASGRFREDLFYRLNVVPLHMPALQASGARTCPLLAAHFAAKAAEKHDRPLSGLDPALLEALQEYDWPGNVRELENMVERLVVLTKGAQLGVEFLPEKMLRVQCPTSVAPGRRGRRRDDARRRDARAQAPHGHRRAPGRGRQPRRRRPPPRHQPLLPPPPHQRTLHHRSLVGSSQWAVKIPSGIKLPTVIWLLLFTHSPARMSTRVYMQIFC